MIPYYDELVAVFLKAVDAGTIEGAEVVTLDGAVVSGGLTQLSFYMESYTNAATFRSGGRVLVFRLPDQEDTE